MRGKVSVNGNYFDTVRITPAYAGKSMAIPVQGKDARDHPRLCGEKFASPAPRVNGIGSPPPMRGKDNFLCKFYIAKGITPAYAGKSASCCCRHAKIRDHPRLCGEKHLFQCRVQAAGGITPAYAGKSETQK